MVPCPWARDAAAMYRGEDVGVHLTLNSEWSNYRWGPITHSPSLLDGDGGFPRTVEDVWDHADLDEVRKECRAQVERAIYWGFDVIAPRQPHGHDAAAPRVLRRVPRDRDRLRAPAAHGAGGGRAPDRLPVPHGSPSEEGVVFPDHFVYTNVGSRMQIERRCSPRSHPASPRSTCTPRSTPTSCARRIPTGTIRVDDHAFAHDRPDRSPT